MSKNYNKTFTSLKTVLHDTSILDAQKILINTEESDFTERKNIIEHISEKNNEIVDFLLGKDEEIKEEINALDENNKREHIEINEKIDSLITLEAAEKSILPDVIDNSFNRYSIYDNNIFDFAIEGGGDVYTSSVRYGYNHFPKGVIKKVSFYGRNASSQNNDSKTNGCYLIAKIYKTNGQLVRSHSSKNKTVVVEKQNSDTIRPLNSWEFDGFQSIEEDEVIKFIPSSDGINQTSNYHFGVLVDTTHTHGSCSVGGDDDFVNNPLGQGAAYMAFAQFEGDFFSPIVTNSIITPYEKNFLQTIYTKSAVKIFDNNINNESLGQAQVKGWILEKPYITNGSFNEIRWTSLGTANSTCYIIVTLRDKYGKDIRRIVSKNSENFNYEGLKSFSFDDFEITDDISSLRFETSTDGVNISTSALVRIRVIGNATNNEAGGSESTNSNFITHCEFWSSTASLGGDILTKTQAELTYANKRYEEIVDTYCSTLLGKVAGGATEEGEVNAINYVASVIPHEQGIEQIILPALNSCSSPYYLAVWTIDGSDRKTYRGLSDNAITWSEGTNATWNFVNNPITVPTGHKLEIFLTDGEGSVGNTEVNVPAHHIKVRIDYSGSGTIRYGADWYSGRNITTEFRTIGIIDEHIGDESHLTEEQRVTLNGLEQNYLKKEDAATSYSTKNEVTEIANDVSDIQNSLNEIEETIEERFAEFPTKTEIESELGNYVTQDSFDSYIREQYHDLWTNLKDGDIVDKATVTTFQLSKDDFITGRIDRIEIPYIAGLETEGYLCVQFIDSSNNIVSVHYSNNIQKQDVTGDNNRGVSSFAFNTFVPPSNYSFVRFGMVSARNVLPTSISMRVMPIKRNNTFTWNTNETTQVSSGQKWTILIRVLKRNYAKRTGITVRNYDWTPDVYNSINVSLPTSGAVYVAPTNGWLISKSSQTSSGANSLTLNGIEIAKSSTTAQPDVQILIRGGEFVTATTAYTLSFYPCKSEQYDYRDANLHTVYDIWKGAVIYDENGEITVQDLYVPDASQWKSEVGNVVTPQIHKIVDEKAYNSYNVPLFNIQSQYIENGRGMFVQSTIVSFSGSLEKLKVGEQMFGYSKLEQWDVNMPLLWNGDTMFYNCSNLTTFKSDLTSLTSAWNMFNGCSLLNEVEITSLENLTDGSNMFKNCNLSYSSFVDILSKLPNNGGNRTIDITLSDESENEMCSDSRFAGLTIPAVNSGSSCNYTHNNWTVKLTSKSGFTCMVPSSYDISEANGNVVRPGQWWQNVAQQNFEITHVINGIAYSNN